ncbi:MAG: TCR/Tet family MFS transporter [Methanobacteriota archaeon]|nr:MAG: TCR/Tet family MFS transporter [Euryarchaeota archaeon]
MAFIYVTIILDTLALGITIPVLPHLITNFVGDKAETAAIYGLLVTIWGLMQFLFSPLIGVLSDRFGRRPVLILSGFGLGLDYIIMALAQSLPWFFVGRILSGIMSSSFATAAAYVADVTPVERRAGAFGMVGAAWGIGFIAGPAIGGVLGTFGIRIPFWGAAAFSLASASYGLFVLPESLSREHRQRLAWRRANPVGSLTLLRSHPTLFGLAAVTFVQFMAFQVLPTVFVLYAFDRFGWREFQVGLSLALVGALNITVQGGLVRRFIARFGERKALLTGLLFGSAALVVWGLAPNDIVLLLAAFVFAPIGFVAPALQSLMTRRVGPSEQGQLQGANASIAGLTGAIGPIFFGLVYSLAIGYRAQFDLLGLPFLVAAVLMLGAVGVAVRVTRLSSTVADRGLPVVLPEGGPPTSAISLSESDGPVHSR